MILRDFRSVWSFVGLMWLAFIASIFFPFQFFGIRPRTVIGLVGIPLGPFLHGDLLHLLMNTLGIFTFGFLFFALQGARSSNAIWFIIWVEGFLTWLFARPGNHIGASGVVFGLFGYLVALGFFHRRLLYILISLVVLALYGGMLVNMLPLAQRVSWEAHLFGFVAGVLCARYRRY